MFSQIWQSEEIVKKQTNQLTKKRPGLDYPALHPFPSKRQASERKVVFKIIILNFINIGPPSKAYGQEQKWGYRTERGFGPGRSEERHQLSHHQQDWTPSQLSMGLLYHQHAARSSGVWTILKLWATAGHWAKETEKQITHKHRVLLAMDVCFGTSGTMRSTRAQVIAGKRARLYFLHFSSPSKILKIRNLRK